jgi:hypothetical protein
MFGRNFLTSEGTCSIDLQGRRFFYCEGGHIPVDGKLHSTTGSFLTPENSII